VTVTLVMVCGVTRKRWFVSGAAKVKSVRFERDMSKRTYFALLDQSGVSRSMNTEERYVSWVQSVCVRAERERRDWSR
jgi:hypothetical protein